MPGAPFNLASPWDPSMGRVELVPQAEGPPVFGEGSMFQLGGFMPPGLGEAGPPGLESASSHTLSPEVLNMMWSPRAFTPPG